MPVGKIGLLGRNILGAGGKQTGKHSYYRHCPLTQVGGQGEKVDKVGSEAEGIGALQSIEVDPQLLVLAKQGNGVGPDSIGALVRV